jgi:hypothetical protein
LILSTTIELIIILQKDIKMILVTD